MPRSTTKPVVMRGIPVAVMFEVKADAEPAPMAQEGIGTEAISRKVGLSPYQVAYRLEKLRRTWGMKYTIRQTVRNGDRLPWESANQRQAAERQRAERIAQIQATTPRMVRQKYLANRRRKARSVNG